ncbi:TonB-dependent receptor [Terriglobus saanensis]|uniref:TonB-dependent receptor plug n=1 Tax=Terriglobus saanensis (strain ATCC BAA-1853 / DSM 23119 / SP1PR4) TaxID=401053 RepID=E8UXN7_TERSS|nr:TonB-dependent receptor [Terriglobus saanensis]ADV81981.1 TonB-dependent receptor plug [Terriglobus saanensis SP1PR4]
MKKHRKISHPARILAMGTLAVYATASKSQTVAPQSGQNNATGASNPSTLASSSARRFNIAAGTLEGALNDFRAQSAVEVNVKLPMDKLQGIQTPAVSGLYTPSVAMRRLLENTGLSFKFAGPDKLDIVLRNDESVDVSSLDILPLSTFTQPLLDTAQTVNVVPQFIIQEQAANTLRETLRNIPGISLAAGEGGAQGDNLNIRGFSARNDMFLDGIRDFGSYYRDSFDYESVSVIQGPASVEFGRGSTGGVINQESKAPMSKTSIRGGLQLGTNLNRRVNLDVNKPLDEYIAGAAFRMNLVGQQSQVAGRNNVEMKRFGVATALSFGMNSNTRWNLNYLHEAEDSLPDYGLPYFYAKVAPVDRHNFYGFVDDNWLRTSPDIISGRVDHDFSPNVSLRSSLRWGNYPRDVRITEPQIGATATLAGVGAVQPNGNYASYNANCGTATCFLATAPITSIGVTRNQIQARSTEDILWEQTALTAHLRFFGIENDSSFLLEGGRERSAPVRPRYTVATTPATAPSPGDLFVPLTITAPSITHVASQSYGFNFIDTLKITRWVQLSGGIRFDYFNTHSDAFTPTTSTTTTPIYTGTRVILDHLDKMPTYRAAIAVKPRPNGTVYFDYGTSFNPSAESLSLSANNATLPPETNETYEVGSKWDVMNGKLNLSGAWFRTEKMNAKETSPLDSTITLVSGTQLVQGVQFGAIGHLPRHFDVILGYAYLAGRLESSALNASPFASLNLGFYNNWQTRLKTDPNAVVDPRYNTAPFYINPANFPLANVGKNTGNLWVTHDLGWRFVGGFGTNYIGARRASSSSLIGIYNTAATPVTSAPLAFKTLPGYWNFDAMMRRPLTDNLNLQVNVFNLTNGFYIAQPHPNHLIPGEGINAQIGLNLHF